MTSQGNDEAQWHDDTRAEELKERLAAVHHRIEAATKEAGRAEAPRLIVVTKFHPADDVRRLAALGITDVGENRDQEAASKAAELSGLDIRWHFIGQLQSNKAKSVAKYASSVQSIDRPQVVDALAKAIAREQDATGRDDLDCYIQVSLDNDAGAHRGGAAPSAVGELAARIESSAGLRLSGLMAVAPLGADPEAAFAKLAGISADLRVDYPAATGISAGMSQDLEAAVKFGATHLRIGSDILGSRPAVG
ncbi:YggS family pyridoxal phosphate-dependent enzyme [Paenarthrobacter nitroguajacolicus]|uniref:YggS family pyridoxal phosphate-dependent enzyme n=1 Tax=Paenarthrobacter nitroguajacolicus TaxID=211146 RepID=UPI00248C9B41|nr:YggS family pyridoxal phosphate-dependent enzyme [Paenarthrobacter nitroguajacolicus]MDI2036308.1 Pyridoxal phosphate homeostasis protein [Paenarthrobacter nitroguajacolicus]